MNEVEPFDLDPYEARYFFADYKDGINDSLSSAYHDIYEEIIYSIYHNKHPNDFSEIEPEVVDYLINIGLKPDVKLNKKANPDYYYAAYEVIDTYESFNLSGRNWDFTTKLNNLLYLKSKLAIMDSVDFDGKPKIKLKNKTGYSQGAKAKKNLTYRHTRKLALELWDKYKETIQNWTKLKQDHENHDKVIRKIIGKDFEIILCNEIFKLKHGSTNPISKAILDEKYTDKVTSPRPVVGWVLAHEGLPNSDQAKKEENRKKRLMMKSKFQKLKNQLKTYKNQ